MACRAAIKAVRQIEDEAGRALGAEEVFRELNWWTLPTIKEAMSLIERETAKRQLDFGAKLRAQTEPKTVRGPSWLKKSYASGTIAEAQDSLVRAAHDLARGKLSDDDYAAVFERCVGVIQRPRSEANSPER